jgi:hypothetical protein
MISSCNCLTKTPNATYHSADCRYSHLNEALNYIENLETRLCTYEQNLSTPPANLKYTTICNMSFSGITNYVCNNYQCPIFPRISCEN